MLRAILSLSSVAGLVLAALWLVREVDSANSVVLASGGVHTATLEPRRRAETRSRPQRDSENPSARRRVLGTVQDERGEPVVAFRVRARRLGDRTPTVGKAFRSPIGSFGLAGLTTGKWSLEVSASGHVTHTVEVRVPALERIRIALERTATLRGRVVHADGRPAPGARVGVDARARDMLWVAADPEGVFVAEGLPPGTLRVTARAAGYPRSEPLSLALEPGQTLTDVALALPERPGTGDAPTGAPSER